MQNEVLQFLVQLVTNPIILGVVALIGLPFTVLPVMRRKPRVKLCYNVQGLNVLGGTKPGFSSDIEIRFRGAVVPRVTASRIVVWNGGREPITRSMIAPKNPLTFDLAKDDQCLNFAFDRNIRPENDFSLQIDPLDQSSLFFDFEFIDPGEGVWVEIIHTSRKRVTLSGTVIGSKESPLPVSAPLIGPDRKLFNLLNGILTELGLFVTVVSIFQLGGYMLWLDEAVLTPENSRYTSLGIGVGFVTVGVAAQWFARQPFPKELRNDAAL